MGILIHVKGAEQVSLKKKSSIVLYVIEIYLITALQQEV